MSTKPILILDDGESVRDVMGQFFWDERFEVCQASSKQEALRMVRENPFELVVIDLKIPCPDSLEVLRQIRQIQPDTVVLILTGYPYVETRPKAQKLGSDAYLTKPVKLNEMNCLVTQDLMHLQDRLNQGTNDRKD